MKTFKNALTIKGKRFLRNTKNQFDRKSSDISLVHAGFQIAMLGVALEANPAFAQLARASTFANTVSTTLMSVGIATGSSASLWTGYKMMFKGSSFGDVSHLLGGGLLAGGATAIGGYLMAP